MRLNQLKSLYKEGSPFKIFLLTLLILTALPGILRNL